MSIRNWIRVIAGIVIMAGLTCLPMGLGGNPYRFTSPFEFFVESGAYIRFGMVAIGSGILGFILSFVGGVE
jgi:hypothetical protein